MAANRVQNATPAAATQMWSRASDRRTRRRMSHQPRPGMSAGRSAARPPPSPASAITSAPPPAAIRGTFGDPCRPKDRRADAGRSAAGPGRGVRLVGNEESRPHRAGPRDQSLRLTARAVTRRRDPLRAGDLPPDALVLDLDLLLADRVADGLGAGVDVLAQPDLLDHARLLGDDRLLAALAGRDLLLLERGIAGLHRTVDRAALDLDPLLAQVDLLLDRPLDNVAAHPHATAADLALADPDLLLGPLHHAAFGDVARGRGAGGAEAGRGRAGGTGRRGVPGRVGGTAGAGGGRHAGGRGARGAGLV